MKIFFAGAMGAEMKDERLKKIISKRRLVSYFYMTKGLNKAYFLKGKENGKKEVEKSGR